MLDTQVQATHCVSDHDGFDVESSVGMFIGHRCNLLSKDTYLPRACTEIRQWLKLANFRPRGEPSQCKLSHYPRY
jgi:hypothetical protein